MKQRRELPCKRFVLLGNTFGVIFFCNLLKGGNEKAFLKSLHNKVLLFQIDNLLFSLSKQGYIMGGHMIA